MAQQEAKPVLPSCLWQLFETACALRTQAVLRYGMHSNEWLRADMAVKKCQRALNESLKPSSPDDDPVTLPQIPILPCPRR